VKQGQQGAGRRQKATQHHRQYIEAER
jgi:hypothetical protein